MDKVYCPYCGTEMVIRDWHDVFFGKGNFFECVCGAKSPIKVSPDTALTAALRRYVEPNRVLTLEDIKTIFAHGGAIWMQQPGETCGKWVESELQIYSMLEMTNPRNTRDDWIDLYGRWWRAWLRRPTDAEREEVAWE